MSGYIAPKYSLLAPSIINMIVMVVVQTNEMIFAFQLLIGVQIANNGKQTKNIKYPNVFEATKLLEYPMPNQIKTGINENKNNINFFIVNAFFMLFSFFVYYIHSFDKGIDASKGIKRK